MPPKPSIRLPTRTSPLPTSKIKNRAPAPANLAKPAKPAQHPLPTARPSQPHRNRKDSHTDTSSSRYVLWATHGTFFLCGMIFLRDYFIDYQHVKGSSMAPTLNPRAHETGEEDSVIIHAWHAGVEQKRNKGILGWRGSAGEADTGGYEDSDGIRRGDVITFWKPHRPAEISIKRVIGLPGDTVYPLRGYALDPHNHVHRLPGLPDGLRDVDEDAISSSDEELGKVVVPYGHLWIEGDNWRRSLDSNDFGPISKGLVIGKARWVWRGGWPFGEVGDARKIGERGRTRVVVGREVVPARFLE